SGGVPAFVFDKPLLALESASIARERSIRTDHAMARYHDRNPIGSVRQADGTHCARMFQTGSERAIADRFARWDCTQRLPHSSLKCGSRGLDGQRLEAMHITSKVIGERSREPK